MKCHDCNTPLRPHNRTGYCQHCSGRHKCPACGARRARSRASDGSRRGGEGRGYCAACRAVCARLHELRVEWGDLRCAQHSPPDVRLRVAGHRLRAALGLPLFA